MASVKVGRSWMQAGRERRVSGQHITAQHDASVSSVQRYGWHSGTLHFARARMLFLKPGPYLRVLRPAALDEVQVPLRPWEPAA